MGTSFRYSRTSSNYLCFVAQVANTSCSMLFNTAKTSFSTFVQTRQAKGIVEMGSFLAFKFQSKPKRLFMEKDQKAQTQLKKS